MKTQKAFTFLELMTVLVVVGILVSIAIPNMRRIMLNGRITTKTNEFVRAINYIRNEAIIRNNNTTIQVGSLVADPDADNEFGDGWRVWVDLNANGTSNTSEDINEDVIKEFTFSGDKIVIDADNSPIIYGNRGLPISTYEFHICKHGYYQGRIVTILHTGRVKTERCYLDGSSQPVCDFSC
jgi:prepilin-type N-terminal cleavage/methylation domain-containing protein